MHRSSSNTAERTLIRDLIVLQKSWSLRDPSTSPRSWVSPSIAGSFSGRSVKDSSLKIGRSFNVDQRRVVERLSSCLAATGGVTPSKVTGTQASGGYNLEQEGNVVRLSNSEEISSKSSENLSKQTNSHKHSSEAATRTDKRKSKKSANGKVARVKSLSEQLEEASNQNDCDNKITSWLEHDMHADKEEKNKGQQEKAHELCHLPRRGKKLRAKSSKNTEFSSKFGGLHAQKTLFAALNSEAKCSANHEEFMRDKHGDLKDGKPKIMCGIPWNWSRIHDSGKTFLDKAGKSFYCGPSDSRVRKTEKPHLQGENILNIAPASDKWISPMISDSEVRPLLVDASESEDNGASNFLSNEHSEELKILSDNNLHNQNSNFASEAISGDHWKSCVYGHGRHRSLTQKYMPKTFKDLVGQTLVVQVLSNAIQKNRVGLIYVFYGPHGTGKTSCARVFSKALNCLSIDHPRPCDACTSCISHNLGKNRDALEVGTTTGSNFENAMNDFLDAMTSDGSSKYKVLIFDDSDTLPPTFWAGISEIVDRASHRVVIIFISLNLHHFPHIIMSRGQKFFFPKVKESDIISTLQWISSIEGLDIDKDALKLIASRSNGSLRDAEMTVDQLILLGQRVSVSLVQELVGLVSDEKLVDLLDLALSADTVNTVKNLREIIESGVEPLSLMSQLATAITDILAGSYVFTRERTHRKFFSELTLSKEDMEKLRQALKILSEAEKQLRVSNDKLTWLTAALLQLAPDPQYLLSSSSRDRSLHYSPAVMDYNNMRGMARTPTNKQYNKPTSNKHFPRGSELRDDYEGENNVPYGDIMLSRCHSIKGQGESTSGCLALARETMKENKGPIYDINHKNTKRVWQSVLANIQSDALRQFLSHEGTLISVNLDAAPSFQLVFGSKAGKTQAERFRREIAEAFEVVLAYAVTLEIGYYTRKIARSNVQVSSVETTSENGSSPKKTRRQSTSNQRSLYSGSQCIKSCQKEILAQKIEFGRTRRFNTGHYITTESEIIETGDHHENNRQIQQSISDVGSETKSTWTKEHSSSDHQRKLVPFSERMESKEQNQEKGLVRGEESLTSVIEQAEDCKKQGSRSRSKALSIAEKLEQQNLAMEPRSRNLLCWRASTRTQTKLLKLRISSRRRHNLKKLAACGRCLTAKSP